MQRRAGPLRAVQNSTISEINRRPRNGSFAARQFDAYLFLNLLCNLEQVTSPIWDTLKKIKVLDLPLTPSLICNPLNVKSPRGKGLRALTPFFLLTKKWRESWNTFLCRL